MFFSYNSELLVVFLAKMHPSPVSYEALWHTTQLQGQVLCPIQGYSASSNPNPTINSLVYLKHNYYFNYNILLLDSRFFGSRDCVFISDSPTPAQCLAPKRTHKWSLLCKTLHRGSFAAMVQRYFFFKGKYEYMLFIHVISSFYFV